MVVLLLLTTSTVLDVLLFKFADFKIFLIFQLFFRVDHWQNENERSGQVVLILNIKGHNVSAEKNKKPSYECRGMNTARRKHVKA